jgi:2,5-diketo-D-gluconate reductase A
MTNGTMLDLNDGRQIPRLGFGVWQINNSDAVVAVQHAIAAGYRLIDTASAYGNEAGVGGAIASAGRCAR